MITLELITPKGILSSMQVHEVLVPTRSGQIGVLEGHEHLVSITTAGAMIIRHNASDDDSQMEYYAVAKDGVIEVTQSKIQILVDEAEKSDDIDENEARKAYEAATKMVNEAKDKQSLDQAMASLDRTAVRLHVSELKRRKRN